MAGSIFSGRPLERAERLQIAILVGAAAGLAAYLSFQLVPDMVARDFTYPWRGGRAILAGDNPYVTIRPQGPPPYEMYFMYPMTAALAALPFALFVAQVGGALFVAAGAAALTFAITRDGLGRCWMLVSPSFMLAVVLGQWSPILIAAALLTPLAWLLTCKPTIGLALFTFRPGWRPAVICAAFVALAFLIEPRWLSGWLQATGTVREHYIPALRPLGILALLALVRWRRGEARVVAAMALVPQNMYFYDQLPLWLAARSGRATLLLTSLAWVAWVLAERRCGGRPFCGPEAEPWVIGLLYLPAAAMAILSDRGAPQPPARPNESGAQAPAETPPTA
jgi:hypothetical protein